ncbi:MAG: DinB family protein, partial [Anaerolineae bacterium]|nr:DinB family protein [Anaerolineae bacterium]
MDRSPIAEIRQKLEESRRSTLQLIHDIDQETATFRPRPDAWSIKEHVNHLAAVEESIIHFAHR